MLNTENLQHCWTLIRLVTRTTRPSLPGWRLSALSGIWLGDLKPLYTNVLEDWFISLYIAFHSLENWWKLWKREKQNSAGHKTSKHTQGVQDFTREEIFVERNFHKWTKFRLFGNDNVWENFVEYKKITWKKHFLREKDKERDFQKWPLLSDDSYK